MWFPELLHYNIHNAQFSAKKEKENRRIKYEQTENTNNEIKNYKMELNRNSENQNNQNEKNHYRVSNSRFDQAKYRICKAEGRSIEVIQSKEQKDKWKNKNEQSLRDLWDTIKKTIAYLKWDSQKERKKRKR